MGCSGSKQARGAVLHTDPTKVARTDSNATTTAAAEQKKKKHKWHVPPGYSSGASSYDSENDLDSSDHQMVLPNSVHSTTLALSALRDEIVAEGDISKTVVRIETPFGKPIEEIYDGVRDGSVLGSGVSGVVRLVTHRALGIKYAVKCLDIGMIATTEGLQRLRDEIFIMCQLDHPNIVRIEEVYESTNEIFIVQELCLGGDLFDRLDEQPDYHYTEAQCARLVKQMLSAVRYLHSKGIVHRDLKLENFLFSSREPDSELKMIDFGLSKHFEVGETHNEKVGTPYTVAPEIIRGSYDEKCDIWAIGVITYLLLSGETPFGGLDGESLALVKQNIERAQVRFVPDAVWKNVSPAAKRFVRRLLNANPAKRPTAQECQLDDWIQVWAKKGAKDGNKLDERTVNALMSFKETSDMQKLLSEVLSFTLLPEQIVGLRKEFEKIDTNGDGEISLSSLKQVLMENAEAGSLGALTEQEVEDLFDAIRLNKTEPYIRWHEFLAAGLSQARVDERNLRLAFDRMDTDRKGYITFENLQDLIGSSTEADALEQIWADSLKQCKSRKDRLTYDDFKKLMKGQHEPPAGTGKSRASLQVVAEEEEVLSGELPVVGLAEEVNIRSLIGKGRSQSLSDEYGSRRSDIDYSHSDTDLYASSSGLLSILHARLDGSMGEISTTPLANNRALYRKHREMRMAVLEASIKFDQKRNERDLKEVPTQAGLIMKRGQRAPVELRDKHNRALFEAAAQRCGRAKRTGNKTVSDVTGMLLVSSA